MGPGRSHPCKNPTIELGSPRDHARWLETRRGRDQTPPPLSLPFSLDSVVTLPAASVRAVLVGVQGETEPVVLALDVLVRDAAAAIRLLGWGLWAPSMASAPRPLPPPRTPWLHLGSSPPPHLAPCPRMWAEELGDGTTDAHTRRISFTSEGVAAMALASWK